MAVGVRNIQKEFQGFLDEVFGFIGSEKDRFIFRVFMAFMMQREKKRCSIVIVKVCFPGLQHQHLLGNYYMQILRSESRPSKTEPQPWVQEPVLLKLQGWLRDIAVKAAAVNASYSKVQALDGQYQHHS